MEFRLTFEGPLRSSNVGRRPTEARRDYKHWVRQQFHPQLKALWQQTAFLGADDEGPNVLLLASSSEPPDHTPSALAQRFSRFGFSFVPLVTTDLGLSCSIEVLYLRRMNRKELPAEVLSEAGDIDNRLKTLFDCLQLPDANQGYESLVPSTEEVPFFCLLENDRLVSKVSVETDRLLQEVCNPWGDNENDARLVITVRIRPQRVNLYTLRFV